MAMANCRNSICLQRNEVSKTWHFYQPIMNKSYKSTVLYKCHDEPYITRLDNLTTNRDIYLTT